MMVPFVNGWTSLVESSAIGALTAWSGGGPEAAHDLGGPSTAAVRKKTLGITCMFMWIILAALAFGAVFDGLGAVKCHRKTCLPNGLGLKPLDDPDPDAAQLHPDGHVPG